MQGGRVLPPFSMPRNDKNLIFRWLEHVSVKLYEKKRGIVAYAKTPARCSKSFALKIG